MKLRIKFAKYGPVKFIGHLDIMRYFQKAIRRAQIGVTYTGGYSPHQVMAFAAPLSVGLESRGEYFDIQAHAFFEEDAGIFPSGEKEGCEAVCGALNRVMAPGIEILRVTLLPENAGNAMASVAAAEYEVSFREGHKPDFDWISQFREFAQLSEMLVVKKTKKSEAQLNLKPFIYSLSVSKEGRVQMLVDASSSGNIKPSLILRSFLDSKGIELGAYDLEITRLETYRQKEAEGGSVLVPMDCF